MTDHGSPGSEPQIDLTTTAGRLQELERRRAEAEGEHHRPAEQGGAPVPPLPQHRRERAAGPAPTR